MGAFKDIATAVACGEMTIAEAEELTGQAFPADLVPPMPPMRFTDFDGHDDAKKLTVALLNSILAGNVTPADLSRIVDEARHIASKVNPADLSTVQDLVMVGYDGLPYSGPVSCCGKLPNGRYCQGHAYISGGVLGLQWQGVYRGGRWACRESHLVT